MDVEQSTAILWNALQEGRHYPEALSGKLTLKDAYLVQMGILNRHIQAGESHVGWKAAFTAPGPRETFGAKVPGHGYLLARAQRKNGARLNFDAMTTPAVEAELIMTLKSPLTGPGVTAEQVREALGAITPGFEVLERRGNMAADLPLGVADNILQSAFLGGDPVSPPPDSFSPEDILVEIVRNGEVFKQVRGAEAIDNHFGTIAFLANELAHYGHHIAPGQLILTGSFNSPANAEKGDHWVAKFSGIGEAELFFD